MTGRLPGGARWDVAVIVGLFATFLTVVVPVVSSLADAGAASLYCHHRPAEGERSREQ